jgi:hypothetical protein
MTIFYLFIMHFSHNFSNRISNLMSNMTHNMIKTQMLLHQALNYSQIYNFTLDHDSKFNIIIMLKAIWISKSKRIYVFSFFECFEHIDPFLWNILKFIKKLKWINEHLIRKKNLKQKNHMFTWFFWMF